MKTECKNCKKLNCIPHKIYGEIDYATKVLRKIKNKTPDVVDYRKAELQKLSFSK